jgi:hypothetical protein
MASGYWPWSQQSHEPPLNGADATAQDYRPAYSPLNTSTHNTTARNSYELNQQTIPGLALSFSGAPSGLQSLGASNPAKPQETTFAHAEEGELSEGELEDLYEPQEPTANINGEQIDNRNEVGRVGASGFLRDRSGSYSPCLSAGEMDTDLSEPHQAESKVEPGAQSVEDMKSRAQEAILRLRLADVQHQDFINEGIDRSVIDQLFSALGLEVPTSRGSKSLSQPITAQKTPEHITNPEIVAQVEKSTTPTTKDKSEERKDRIARLLAAKGSKASTVVGGATTVGKVAKPSGGVKVNSEKSKLLQKKMEALLKAREAQQQERTQHDTTDSDVKDNTTAPGQEDVVPDTSAMNGIPNAQAEQESSSRSSPTFAIDSSKPGGPSLDTNSAISSSEAPFKKPFGQNRETRPFLIDVSDDDDDTDMELDSPEQHTCTNTGTKPSHGVGAVLDEEALRQLSSPGSVSTPTALKGANRPDLASMNKKIEAMKLKIAEAEARKKAKLSQQASPADSPTLSARAANDDPTNVNLRSASPATSADARAELNLSSVRLHRAVEGSSSPQAVRGGRSRAASERLPLLESRRREQLLKLKALQSQVANIERELNEGLAEEERLRGDLDYISDDDIEAPAIVSQPRLSGGSEQNFKVDTSYAKLVDLSGQVGYDGEDQSDVVSSDHVVADDNAQPVSTVPMVVGDSRGMSTVAEEDMATESGSSVAQEDLPSTEVPSIEGLAGIADDKDVIMQDARQASGDEVDDDSDGYEPPDVTDSESDDEDARSKSDQNSMDRVGENQDPDVAALNAELISAGRQDSVPETERQVEASLLQV